MKRDVFWIAVVAILNLVAFAALIQSSWQEKLDGERWLNHDRKYLADIRKYEADAAAGHGDPKELTSSIQLRQSEQIDNQLTTIQRLHWQNFILFLQVLLDLWALSLCYLGRAKITRRAPLPPPSSTPAGPLTLSNNP